MVQKETTFTQQESYRLFATKEWAAAWLSDNAEQEIESKAAMVS